MRNAFTYLLLAVSVFYLIGCANPVTPTGGPKDTDPPEVLASEPPNQSRNFSENRIEITFDEFVKLDQPNQNILISPPIEKNPDYRLRGKSLVTLFNEPLKDSTTYTIFFGNSIVDLTEGNPLKNYQFVFSTGEQIDSLSIRGQILDAFNLQPYKDVFVMLYVDNNDTIPYDSLPYYVKPYYVSKTNANGFFELNNLREMPYRIFALQDVNSNMIYDLPNEKIAFLDSLLVPEYYKAAIPDTTKADTSLNDPESKTSDSLLPMYPDNVLYELFMFDEIDSTQKLLEAELAKKRMIRFVFKFETTLPQINILNETLPESRWKIEDMNPGQDTLIWWLREIPFDTLFAEVMDDTLVLDTVRIVLSKEEKQNRRNDEEEKPDYLRISNNLDGKKADLHRPLIIGFPYPLDAWEFSEFILVENEDSLKPMPHFKDSIVRQSVVIDHSWKEDASYRLFFPDSIFTDIRGLSNDTLLLDFSSRSLGDYGIIKLNIDFEKECPAYIVQLLNQDEAVIREKTVSSGGEIGFEYLDPDTYLIKIIYDCNNNGRWDTGDYPEKRQPEKVAYFPKSIEVRPNWLVEEDWLAE
ncbi:MAG: Ig-like domain-containing protein [Bacteroidales bacterium]|nr:Ig-like domain-containing protein [Bacteroidales bacterium]MCF8343258.1 Ig-like domain-containing protein [Bacteroidales bacterium]MCF8376432.1 Ig-like domain-containing protein [Bacteroidales bacterium]MCF8400551.1 Ig-like domain-containing protein [Bacteroidales bacterium]